jgi:chaperone required for assembly of F1-ATPase
MSAARRFYAQAAILEAAGGFGVSLDARALKTPAGRAFVLPTRTLAEACAAEWNAQGEHIVPASMPLTQLAFAALDWTAASRAERAAYVASFAETDLCCHRAERPAELTARQAAAWDPLLAWGEAALGVRLPVVEGVIAAGVDPSQAAILRNRAEALGDFPLTALTQTAGLTGSALIAFALLEGRLGADAAFTAAALDELWSLEHWGEDAEARARLDGVRGELKGVARFVHALSE